MQRRDSMKVEYEKEDRVRARFSSCPDIASVKNLLKENETNEVSKSIQLNSIKNFISRKEQQIKVMMEKQTEYIKEQKAQQSMQTGKLIQNAMSEINEAQKLVTTIQSTIYKEKAQETVQKALDLDVNKADKNELQLAKVELQRANKAISGDKNFDLHNIGAVKQLQTISGKIQSIEKAIERKSLTHEDLFMAERKPSGPKT